MRFDSLSISPLTARAVRDVFKYEKMSGVQAASLPVIQRGIDVCVKAKTGTGKTLAFLIPTIDVIVNDDLQRLDGARHISALILSPSRELASQIKVEADALLRYHRDCGVGVVFGGTKIAKDQRMFADPAVRVDILVATPGRLVDHLQNTPGFAARCAHLRVLVMDEADQLLDAGFKRDIDRILAFLVSDATRECFCCTLCSS
jgi:ATP-dependent RNA helicase MSS116